MSRFDHITRRAMIGWTLLAGSGLARSVAAFAKGRPAAAGPARAASLEAGFRMPPATARPRSWWHWMNGNVTLDGIAKDLAWMNRVGIGGVHVFDAALDTPQIVDKRVKYMSPEWKQAFHYSAQLLDYYGMEMGIAASPGWSETGGPWVPPEDAMKKVVWSETVVDRSSSRRVALRQPPDTPGVFQDIAIHAPPVGHAPPPPPRFYRDAAVFAFPDADRSGYTRATYTDDAGRKLDANQLTGDDYAGAVELEVGSERGIVADLGKPRAVRSAEFFAHDIYNIFFGSPLQPVLEASDDAETWRKVTTIVVCGTPTTASFAPVTARYWRLRLPVAPTPMGEAPTRIGVARFLLSPEARIHAFEAKAAYSILRDYYALDDDVGADLQGIDPGSVVDLTDAFANGTLDWTPPDDRRWRVIRMGYSLTGVQNHPAVPEATGLEVDKYDARAVRDYISHYLDMYADAVGNSLFGERGLQALLTDSTEIGASNWTPDLVAHFRRLRGYDPRPWLPALMGFIVGSRTRSDGFLYDFRRTLSDLMASEHYGTIADVGRERGLFIYAESLEAGRPALGDDLDMRRFADIPMAALWTWDRSEPSTRPALIADCKGAGSVAHVYGQNVAAAESMTSGLSLYAQSPSELKRVLDLEFALGINRIVIHTSPHQPLDDKVPGLSLQVFGQAFTRHNTWAEMAGPWLDYIARSCFMLQQGRNLADVAYFYGEDGSPTALYQLQFVEDAPRRYGFDYVGALPLTTMAGMQDGYLTFPSGARYRALYLGGSSSRMTVPTLRKLEELVRGGLTVIGPAPVSTPSASDDVEEFAAIRSRLWSGDVETKSGSGRTLAFTDVEAGMARIRVVPDFDAGGTLNDDRILFVHRKIDDGDVYFVTNRTTEPLAFSARFRVKGLEPTIWRAETGEIAPLSYRLDGDQTVVELDLASEDACFVVFRGRAKAPARTVAVPEVSVAARLAGPWTVTFEPDRGGPSGALQMDDLAPLDESGDARVRYFSGVATYRTTIAAPPGKGRLWIDLGKVGDVAEVRVNGTLVGTVWKEPYRLDVGKLWRKGENTVEIKVANLWLNRLIGDLQPGAEKVAFASNYTMSADTPLSPSGLMGPVVLLREGA